VASGNDSTLTNIEAADSSARVFGNTMLSRTTSTNVRSPNAYVGADSGYGELRSFRKQLRKWNEPYILGVGLKHIYVIPESTPIKHPEDASGIGCPHGEP
jgi:hypothetical protein